jgi:electron transfer flavoprotein beta subunit
MQVVVLLAGVVDPKWRLVGLGLRDGTELADESGLPRRLSPFDEAALEIALKLRDADPSVRVTVVLPGDAGSDALLRAVMAFRPHRAFRLDTSAIPLWDPRIAAQVLGAGVDLATDAPDLVLMGREFGDGDDGTLPPLLAEIRGWSFWGQAHAVALAENGFRAQRMRGPREEMVHLPSPALVSLTNDRGNRLRHPLMKNVVLAKRDPVEVLAAPVPETPRALRALSLAMVPPPRRGAGACRVLSGPLEAQVGELAAYLHAWRDGGTR